MSSLQNFYRYSASPGPSQKYNRPTSHPRDLHRGYDSGIDVSSHRSSSSPAPSEHRYNHRTGTPYNDCPDQPSYYSNQYWGSNYQIVPNNAVNPHDLSYRSETPPRGSAGCYPLTGGPYARSMSEIPIDPSLDASTMLAGPLGEAMDGQPPYKSEATGNEGPMSWQGQPEFALDQPPYPYDPYIDQYDADYTLSRAGSEDPFGRYPGFRGQTPLPSTELGSLYSLTSRHRAVPRRSIRDTDSPELTAKPIKDPVKTWRRTNNTTKGGKSRTQKINNIILSRDHRLYDYPDPERHNPPFAQWTSATNPAHTFQYNTDGELLDKNLSPAELRDFIYSHPLNSNPSIPPSLYMWIQRAPADSGARYPTENGSKCRLRCCPAWKQNGTIMHGHYRVAFDENYHVWKETADPFYSAGYVHLYCLEKFLDLPDIAARFNLEVDKRQLPCEPGGKFAGMLSDADEIRVAEAFVHRCKTGTLRSGSSLSDSLADNLAPYPSYPFHTPSYQARMQSLSRAEDIARHENTLCFRMTMAKTSKRPRAQHAQFERRFQLSVAKARAENRAVPVKNDLLEHRNNLEVFIANKIEYEKRKNEVKAGRVVKRRVASGAHGAEDQWGLAMEGLDIEGRVTELGEEDAEGEEDVDEGPAPTPSRVLRSAERRREQRRVYKEPEEDEIEDVGLEPQPQTMKRKKHDSMGMDEDSADDDEWKPEVLKAGKRARR